VKKAYIYVEGGSIGKGMVLFRSGFHDFLVRGLGRSEGFKIVPCGSRGDTFHKYSENLRDNPGDNHVLLVDSEGPVTQEPWKHISDKDHWPVSEKNNDHYHLMVQVMESWFLADTQALADYYGSKFHAASLPKNPRVESINKQDVEKGLKSATRNTPKGEYDKSRHGSEILKRIDTSKVVKAAPHCKRLFDTLAAQLGVEP
jgi:hypothetical protein